jgi:hypothetical protein
MLAETLPGVTSAHRRPPEIAPRQAALAAANR